MGLDLGATLGAVLPHLTAALNALAGILLWIGFRLIRSGRRQAHHSVMTAAVIVSALFLVSYVLHHLTAPVYVFHGQGIVRPIYFFMLTTHVILAVAVTPMVILTFLRARRARALAGQYWSGFQKGDFGRHKALARWTFPIWLYVSVTGVLVYLMVYHIYRNPN
jgi:uncharacterized membrane protein YozB (DUF420 family)